MKVFILERVSELTGNYHSEGGTIVIAKELLADEHANITDEEWEDVIVHDIKGKPEEAVYIFPDAGCC